MLRVRLGSGPRFREGRALAMFVHLTDARLAPAIRRNGLRAARYPLQPAQTQAGGPALPPRAVFCVPMLPDIQASFQWLRTLKASGYRTAMAVRFRVSDEQPVWASHYREWPKPMRAAEAVELFLRSPDPRGLQVMIPRSIAAGEVQRIHGVRQIFGWRWQPDAHGKELTWPAPGGIKAARKRASIRTAMVKELLELEPEALRELWDS